MTNPATLEKDALRFPTIDPGVRIGHVHLKVADLQRALDFYCGVLGFELTT
ncbi:MAG TPA: VOC family protein, partial [Xanthobacteraceae bacterium]|nr:VOC family protein [Xanthobacteraceae bacterium]